MSEQPLLAMLRYYEEPPRAEGRNCKLHLTSDDGNRLLRACVMSLSKQGQLHLIWLLQSTMLQLTEQLHLCF